MTRTWAPALAVLLFIPTLASPADDKRPNGAAAGTPRGAPARLTARDGDWPCFRGPNRDGTSTDRGLPLEWGDTKNIVWKTRLPGAGASSPITFGDRIYVTCYSGYGLSRASPG